MNVKAITRHQLTVLVFILSGSTKILLLPRVLLNDGGRDVWIGFFILIAMDFLVLLGMLITHKMLAGRTFGDIYGAAFGQTAAKIIQVVMAALIILDVCFMYGDNEKLFGFRLYVFSDRTVFTLLAFLLYSFMAFKGIRATARAAELLAIPYILMVIIISVLVLKNFSGEGLFPILENGAAPFMKSSLLHGFWGDDMYVFLFLLGGVRREKRTMLYTILAYVLSAAVIMGIFISYIAAFADIGGLQNLEFSLLDLINLRLEGQQGNMNLFMIISWSFALFFKRSVYIIMGFSLLQRVFKFKKILLPAVIFTALPTALSFFLTRNSADFFGLPTQIFRLIVAGTFFTTGVLTPFVALIAKKRGLRPADAKEAPEPPGEAARESADTARQVMPRQVK